MPHIPTLSIHASNPSLNFSDKKPKLRSPPDSWDKAGAVDRRVIDVAYRLVPFQLMQRGIVNSDQIHFKYVRLSLLPVERAVWMGCGEGGGDQTVRFNFSSNTVQIKIRLFQWDCPETAFALMALGVILLAGAYFSSRVRGGKRNRVREWGGKDEELDSTLCSYTH